MEPRLMVFSLRTQQPLFSPIGLFFNFRGHTIRYCDIKLRKQPVFLQITDSVSVTKKKGDF
jgi:hypothetical protein